MSKYIKLQINYLFSHMFIICYILISLVILIGIYFSSSIDLNYTYIDGFRSEFFSEYLNQSSLIIEVLITITAIFLAGILTVKKNEFLISYTVTSYMEKLYFVIARILVALLTILSMIIVNGLFFLLITELLTPYSVDIMEFINLMTWIFFQASFFQIIAFLLISIFNYFLVILLPLVTFWYKKTIFSFSEIESGFSKFILKNIPSFELLNNEVVTYRNFYTYLLLFIIVLIITCLIDVIKDCS